MKACRPRPGEVDEVALGLSARGLTTGGDLRAHRRRPRHLGPRGHGTSQHSRITTGRSRRCRPGGQGRSRRSAPRSSSTRSWWRSTTARSATGPSTPRSGSTTTRCQLRDPQRRRSQLGVLPRAQTQVEAAVARCSRLVVDHLVAEIEIAGRRPRGASRCSTLRRNSVEEPRRPICPPGYQTPDAKEPERRNPVRTSASIRPGGTSCGGSRSRRPARWNGPAPAWVRAPHRVR